MTDRIDPTPERLKYDNVRPVDLYRSEGPERVRVYRMGDLLSVMRRKGTITAGMCAAGHRFQGLFYTAGLQGVTRLSLVRVSGGRGELSDRALGARTEVHSVLNALGGMGSLSSRALWRILGVGYSIKDFAGEHGLKEEVARGVFVGALSSLAEFLDKGRGSFVKGR